MRQSKKRWNKVFKIQKRIVEQGKGSLINTSRHSTEVSTTSPLITPTISQKQLMNSNSDSKKVIKSSTNKLSSSSSKQSSQKNSSKKITQQNQKKK